MVSHHRTVNVLPHVDVYLRCLVICGNVNSSLCVVIVYRVGISCSKIGKIAVLFLRQEVIVTVRPGQERSSSGLIRVDFSSSQ